MSQTLLSLVAPRIASCLPSDEGIARVCCWIGLFPEYASVPFHVDMQQSSAGAYERAARIKAPAAGCPLHRGHEFGAFDRDISSG